MIHSFLLLCKPPRIKVNPAVGFENVFHGR